MPCPFAPLLSLLPALPFIPWIIGKSMEKLGKKQLINISPELLASLESKGGRIEKDALILDCPTTKIGNFEYYLSGAPHIRKSKSIAAIKVEGGEGEILLFSGSNDFDLIKKIIEILVPYRIMRAMGKNDKLTLKWSSHDLLIEEDLKSLLRHLSTLDLWHALNP